MKNFLIVTILLLTFSATAQDSLNGGTSNVAPMNKRGIKLLPQKGDYSIGVNAAPYLNYLGNFFSQGGTNTSPTSDYSLNGRSVIYGKYFLKDNQAIRVKIQWDSEKENDKRYIRDNNAVITDPLSNATVVDLKSTKTGDYIIDLGYEFRRGRTRLQGFYGGELSLSLRRMKDTYEYGNPYSLLTPNPYTTNFGTNISGAYRLIENNHGNIWGVGVNLFVGVEYFVTPAISLGTELCWGIGYEFAGEDYIKSESWNGSATIENTQVISPKGTNYINTNRNNSGILFLMFHF